MATFDNLAYFWMQGGRLLDDEGRPVFADAENGPKMLRVLELLERAVESGASPSRVTTFTSYDEFETAAQGGAVAMFLGGSFQHSSMEELLGEEEFSKWDVSMPPGPEPGQTATGTGGWTVAAFTDDDEKIAACMDIVRNVYVGAGNELTGELPTSRRLFDSLEAFQAPIYRRFDRYLADGRARPGLGHLPRALQRAADRHRPRPDGLRDAAAGAPRPRVSACSGPTNCWRAGDGGSHDSDGRSRSPRRAWPPSRGCRTPSWPSSRW